MRNAILLAMLLIAVFASGMEMGIKSEMNITGEGVAEVNINATIGMEENKTENLTTITGSAEIESEENITQVEEGSETSISTETSSEFGSCKTTLSYEEGYTILHAKCDLQLPTPCHTVEHSWLPGKEKGTYTFAVWIKQKPVPCVQVIKKTSVEDEIKVKGKVTSVSSRITYIPAKFSRPIKAKIKEKKIERKVPPVVLCAKERVELRDKLRELRIALYEAEQRGNAERIVEIKKEIEEVKEKLEELPSIDECAKMSASIISEKKAEKAKNILAEIRGTDLKLRILNPCDKIEYLQGEIEEKKAELESNITDEQREAIKKEIAMLIDLQNTVKEACEHVKDIPECRNVARMRSRIIEIRKEVAGGETVDVQKVKEMVKEFARMERKCFASIKEDMEEHPCIAAQILGVELKKLTEEGDEQIIDELYKKVQEYREKCREKAKKPEEVPIGPKSGRASEIAKIVGELELAKYQILMDDTLSKEEKIQKIKEIEARKREIIKDTIIRMKRAKLSAAIRARIRPGKIEIEDENITGENVTLELPTEANETINVEVTNRGIKLLGKRTKVHVRGEIEFENGILKFKGRAIKVPEKIAEKIKAKIANLELKEEAGKPVYEGNATKHVKLLAIIPLEAKIQIKADAETGKVTQIKQPWWMLFAVD